jgi:hypothetical protein
VWRIGQDFRRSHFCRIVLCVSFLITHIWGMNAKISQSKTTPREPEPGFERVTLLTPSEIIDLMHLLDQPARSGSAFRLDPNGFVRRRIKGGPIIGKADTVEAAMQTIIQVGIAVLGPYPSRIHGQSNIAPIGDPRLQPESSPAPSDQVEQIAEIQPQGQILVAANQSAASPVAPTDHFGSGVAPPSGPTSESRLPNSAGSGPAPSDSVAPTGPSDSYSVRSTPRMNKERSRSRLVGALCLLFSIVIMLVAGYNGYFWS